MKTALVKKNNFPVVDGEDVEVVEDGRMDERIGRMGGARHTAHSAGLGRD
jgi:hypothetical protein